MHLTFFLQIHGVGAAVLRPDAPCASLSCKTPLLTDPSFHPGQDSQRLTAQKCKTNLIMKLSSVIQKHNNTDSYS